MPPDPIPPDPPLTSPLIPPDTPAAAPVDPASPSKTVLKPTPSRQLYNTPHYLTPSYKRSDNHIAAEPKTQIKRRNTPARFPRLTPVSHQTVSRRKTSPSPTAGPSKLPTLFRLPALKPHLYQPTSPTRQSSPSSNASTSLQTSRSSSRSPSSRTPSSNSPQINSTHPSPTSHPSTTQRRSRIPKKKSIGIRKSK